MLDHRRPGAPVEPSQGDCRDLRQPAPGRDEFRSVGRDEQYWKARRAIDHAVEKLARTGVDPMQVLKYEEDRLPPRQPFELPQQCLKGLVCLALWAQTKRRIARFRWHREKVGEQGEIFAWR